MIEHNISSDIWMQYLGDTDDDFPGILYDIKDKYGKPIYTK